MMTGLTYRQFALRIEAETLIKDRIEKMHDYTDMQLLETFQTADSRLRSNGLEVDEINDEGAILRSYDFLEARAALSLMEQRHGHEYVLGLFGLREPVSATEVIQSFLKGEYPKIKPS